MAKHSRIEPKTGRLLISEPHLNDYYFGKSVVLLADHGEEGSFGLIINKPIRARFNEVVSGFPEFDAPVYLGGPVEPNALFFIHTLGELIEGSARILDGIYWGGNIEQIRTLLETKVISAKQIRFFAGYAGWSPKQLDEELERHSWVVCQASAEEILKGEAENLWTRFLRCLGDDYSIWSNFPPDPKLN
jgi:putative transcriptional regulator